MFKVYEEDENGGVRIMSQHILKVIEELQKGSNQKVKEFEEFY